MRSRHKTTSLVSSLSFRPLAPVLVLMLTGSAALNAATDTWSGSVDGTWNTSTLNWNAGATAFTSGDDALFTGTPANNVTNAAGLTIGAITLDSTFTGSVALTGANTVNGATTVSAGTLALINATALGTSAATVNSPGLLWLQSSSAGLTYANNVSGTGTAKVSPGTDTLQMSGDLSGFTGLVDVFKGPSNWGKLGFSGGSQAKTLSSSATIKLESGATLYLSQAYNYNAAVQVNGGTTLEAYGNLRIESGAVQAGSVTLYANSTIGVNAGTGTISGNISESGGSYGFTKQGGSTLVLTGYNTYSGTTTIGSGTTSVGGNHPFGSGPVVMTGGTLSSAAAATVTNNVTLNGGSTFNGSGGAMVLNGNITGGNSLTLTPAYKITLAGTNSFATSAAYGNLNVNPGAGGVDITGSTTVGSGNSATAGGYINVAGDVGITVQAGGSLSILGTSNSSKPGGIVGQNTTGTSSLTVNGGSLTIGGNLGIAFGNNNATAIGVLTITNHGTATITAGNATLQDPLNFIALGRDNATGIINLAGGTLATGRQFVRDGSNGGTQGAGTATFNFNGGKLQAQASQTAGNGWFETATSGNYQVVTTTVMDNGAIIDNNGFDVNINTALAHGGVAATDGGVTKLGLGTLTLGGVNTYNGSTVVSNGTLLVSGTGSLNAASAVTVAGGNLVNAGSIGGTVTANAGARILPSTGTFGGLVALNSGNAAINLLDATTAAITFANGLTLSNGNQLSFDLGSGGSSDQIAVSGGSFTHNGTVTINLNAIGSIASGTTYTLISDAAADISDTTGFVIGTQPSGFTATLGASGGALVVTLTQNAPAVAYWKGILGNAWNTVSGGTANWTTDAAGTVSSAVPPGTPSSVIFAASGAATFDTFLGADFTINDLTLSTPHNVTIGGATNTLSLISGLLNDTTALNNSIIVSNVVLDGSQTWQNNSANPLTVSSMISGTPALTIGGTGSIILTSTNNNCAGGTVINSGTLQLGDGAANNGTVAGNINNNSALVFANPSALTFSGQLEGIGTLTKCGAGTLTLNHAGNTYSGATTVSQGQLTGNTPGSATGTVNAGVFGNSPTITVSNGASLFIDDAGNGAGNERDLVVASGLAGSGIVEVRAADTHDWDTVVLNGDMSGYTGTIQALTNANHRGKLRLANNTLPSAAAIAVADGTTLYLNTASDYPNAVQLYGAANIENMGALRLESGATLSGPVTLFGNTSIGANTGTETISGAISESGGSYGFSKLLEGTLTLSGANTHSGVTTMANGTLNLANGSALENSTLNLTGGTLVFDGVVASNAFVLGGLAGTAGISLANSFSSPITLTVGGNGGSSSYSGVLDDGGLGGSLTKTGNGTLTLSGANAYSGTATVAGGKLAINTLQTNATAGIVVSDGAALAISAIGTNQLAPASYALGGGAGATNEFSGLSSTTVAPVNTGSLTVNGTIRVDIGAGAFASGNSYPLIAFNSISGSGGFVLGSVPRGMSSASIVTNGSTIALSVVVGSTAIDVWTGVVNTNWDISTTTNWLVGGNPDRFLNGDIARFDDTSSQTNVYVTTEVQPLSVVVSNATRTYTFNGTGIAGLGGLTKQGAGTLVLAQANTYAGNTVVSNGTLKVVAASAIPTGTGKGDVVVGGAGVLDVNATSITLNGLSGNGTVDTLAGGNPTLTVGNNGASATFSGTLQNSSGTLALTKTGNGTLTLSGAANTLSGQLQVTGGTLNWDTAGALAPSAGDYRPLNVTAGGTLNVNGSLKYSSGTAGINGYLNMGNNAVGGYGTVNINPGGTLTFTNQTGNPNSVIGQQGTGGTSSLIVNGGTFNWDGSGGLFIGNGGGSGVLLITNGGTATIHKGAGSADEGYLALGRDGATSSGTLYLASGTLATDRIICQGLAPANGAGYVFFDGGTLKALDNQSDWLQAAVNGNAQPPSGVTLNTGGAVVDANGFSVAINNGLASGSSPDGGLALVDSSAGKNGVLILGGTCAYNGPTTVSNGTLLVNGSISTGATTVRGGTLGGTGALGGSVTVNSGASFAPGSSVFGTLTVTGDIVLQAGSTSLFDVDGSTPVNTAVAAGGAVTYGGILKIVSSGTFSAGQTFTLFSGAGAASASNFSSIQGSPGSGLGFSFTNGVLSVVQAGASGPENLTNSYNASTHVLSLSWPAGQGWRLQMQTNSLSTGLSNNWIYVTDGSVSSTNMTVDPSKPTVFFRLRYP